MLTIATDASNLPVLLQKGVPQVYFDQLNGVHGHPASILPSKNPKDAPNMSPNTAHTLQS